MKRFAGIIAIIAVVGAVFVIGSATLLSHPVQREIGNAPADLGARNVQFASHSGAVVHGWLCEVPNARAVVLLLPGVRGNRLAMLDRARFLRRAGYSALLIDFQGTGETKGAHITFGWLESRDVLAAVSFLRRQSPGERIAIIGQSIGGAATLLATPQLHVDGVILEQVYPTIERATANRLRKYFGPLGSLGKPVLLIYDRALPPKQFWLVPDACSPFSREFILHPSSFILPVRITEIFHSIQGESTHAGRPCVFVRLTGCNLRCRWCDSEYTFTGGERMSLDDVMSRVKSYGTKLVEITGGEPLAQQEAFDLIRCLCDDGFEVLIETSGSIDITPVDRRAKIILDVKCPGSGEAEKNRWQNIDELRPHDEVKFVIADRADYEWAKNVIAEKQLGRWTVLLSPVWGEMDMKSLAEWMLADHVPARFQTQLHKHIWGADVKGV